MNISAVIVIIILFQQKKQFKNLNRIVISYRNFKTLYQNFPFLVLNLT